MIAAGQPRRTTRGAAHGRAAGRGWWLTPLGWLVGGVLATGIAVRAAASDGFYWADDYGHLQLSRLAWHHPTWLLDVWGRPLMTLAYMPGAPLGDTAVRITSFVMFLATALLCVRIAARHRAPHPELAGCLLLAQPLAARLAFAALPYTVFGLVLATALWLRAGNRHLAAAVVVSLLPLARLEGVVVVAIWVAVMAWERRFRWLPFAVAGTLGWAFLGAIVHRDLLWILHANPNGVGTRFGRGGWAYIFHAFPVAAGPVVAGLAVASLAAPPSRDRMIGAVAAALSAFYVIAWGLGAFQTGRTPVYLVTISVPLALSAHHAAGAFLRRGTHVRAAGAMAGAALVVSASLLWRRPIDGAVVVVYAVAVLGFVGLRHIPELRTVATAGAVTLAALVGLALTRPLPLGGGALASKRLGESLGSRTREVRAWTDPAFGWYSRRLNDDRFRGFPSVPAGSYVVRDSELGDLSVTERRLRRLGFLPVQTERAGEGVVTLWQRRGDEHEPARASARGGGLLPSARGDAPAGLPDVGGRH